LVVVKARLEIAAVADDFSGANDLGGRLAAAGLKTFAAQPGGPLPAEAQALILCSQTRLLDRRGARLESAKAWRRLLLRRGARICYQKIDSTLRGWPGDEILGLLESSGAAKIAFCAAYPRHGRVTRGGQIWVHGRRLDKTEYFRDPLSPATCFRPKGLFEPGLALELRSSAGLKRAMQGPARILCFDASTEGDLKRIADACLRAGIRHFAGASGFGAALAACLSKSKAQVLPRLPGRRIILAGSVSQTAFGQMAALRASGAESSHRLGLATLEKRSQLKPGRARAEKALKDLVRRGLKASPDPRLAYWLLTGGHTAETFYTQLGLSGNWVLGELLPGLPLCRAGEILCSTKPGGFGNKNLFTQILRMH
jgi:uncharacterized protein YgbK (DUF1537 family)